MHEFYINIIILNQNIICSITSSEIYWCWWIFKFDTGIFTAPEIWNIKILSPLGINWWFFLLPLNCLAFSYLEVKNFETTSTCYLSTKKHVILGISFLAKSYDWCGLWIALWTLKASTSCKSFYSLKHILTMWCGK